VAVYIDAANVYYSCKDLEWKIDYKKLLDYLRRETNLVQISFYTATDPDSVRQQKFLDFLEINGYRVRSKKVKFIKTPTDAKPEHGFHKGNLDIELALDAWDEAEGFDTFVLVSGDGDFAELIRRLKKRGKWCLVMSSKGHVAKELVQEAKFLDFKKLRDEIAK